MYAHYFSRVFISMCLFILSACAPVTLPSPELRADTAALEAAYTRCSQAFPDAKKRPTKPLFECRSRAARDNPAGIAAYFGPQNVDLVDVGSMRSIVAAEKYDDGKISRAEFDLELASTTESGRPQHFGFMPFSGARRSVKNAESLLVNQDRLSKHFLALRRKRVRTSAA